MVVGLAADCCAVGGHLVDDKLLLISFWWRILRMSLHVAFSALATSCLLHVFFFFCLMNMLWGRTCLTWAERFKGVLSNLLPVTCRAHR